jgi:hypothetical protein
MQIVLDTNVISELRLPTPDPSVMRWFESIDPEQALIAAFTIAEIHYGIAILGERDPAYACRCNPGPAAECGSRRDPGPDAGQSCPSNPCRDAATGPAAEVRR